MWSHCAAPEVKYSTYLVVQSEASLHLRTIVTSAANNPPPHRGCAEKSVTAAGDSGAVSPALGGRRVSMLGAKDTLQGKALPPTSSWWVVWCASKLCNSITVSAWAGFCWPEWCHSSVGHPETEIRNTEINKRMISESPSTPNTTAYSQISVF